MDLVQVEHEAVDRRRLGKLACRLDLAAAQRVGRPVADRVAEGGIAHDLAVFRSQRLEEGAHDLALLGPMGGELVLHPAGDAAAEPFARRTRLQGRLVVAGEADLLAQPNLRETRKRDSGHGSTLGTGLELRLGA